MAISPKRQLQLALNFERQTRAVAKKAIGELSRASRRVATIKVKAMRRAKKPARAPAPVLVEFLVADLPRMVPANAAPKSSRVKKPKKDPNFKHQVRAGQWLYTIWGYDQTNATFYKVLAVSPGMARVQKYHTKNTWQRDKDGRLSPGYEGTAVPGTPDGGPILRKIVVGSRTGKLDSVKVDDSRGHAHPWNGVPVSVSSGG